jgi:hypothetical protein
MVANYTFALALGSSVLTGCAAYPQHSVAYGGYPSAYVVESYSRPAIYPAYRYAPAPRYYAPPRFEHHEHHEHREYRNNRDRRYERG